MNNLIVVPVDFSEQSLIALEQAANVAEVLGSELLMLHVGDEPSGFSSSAKTAAEEKELAVRARLAEMADQMKKEKNVNATFELKEGKIYREIVDIAEEKDARFIIMGTNGSVGLKKKFIGSNALRVVKESSIPVISIKGKRHDKGIKEIVLPLDLTKETKQKTVKAIELAREFGSKIFLISVMDSKDEYVVTHLNRQMEQVQKIVEEQGVPTHVAMIEKDGSIATTILNYSASINADLILIMTQQEQDFTDLFIGSSAQEMINHSEIPILSITPRRVEESMQSIFG